MAHAPKVLDLRPMGCRVELIRTAEETGGELVEFAVIGRPRGLLTQPHVHVHQVERYEVLAGGMRLVEGGREHLLGPGDTMEVGPGVVHAQRPGGDPAADGHVRVQVRPAASTQAFLERLAALCARDEVDRFGLPRPVAAAHLVADFADDGHAARPPVAVQRALSRAVLAVAGLQRPYVFVDQWHVAAPPDAVFAAVADARTYPEWWRPVYLEVDADGPAELGKSSRQHFKGRLPYHLHTRSTVTAIDPPRSITAEVDGDLRGRGTWTLTPTETGTAVRFDWRVHADRPLLRALTPMLRPLLRFNHAWAIARAVDGLEPWAQARAAAGRGADVPLRGAMRSSR
jgi:uncharacterized protein YndB with AHSA1/START domain/quercetin dioxygenase-like cupin family protein